MISEEKNNNDNSVTVKVDRVLHHRIKFISAFKKEKVQDTINRLLIVSVDLEEKSTFNRNLIEAINTNDTQSVA